MNRAVEILFIIGVLINLVKGAELILRPHQQEWLQKNFESLTLWLEYNRPLERYVKYDVIQRLFIIIIVLLTFALFFFMGRDVGGWIGWGVVIMMGALLLIVLGPVLNIKWLILAYLKLVGRDKPSSVPERAELIPIKCLERVRLRVNPPLSQWLFQSRTTAQSIIRPLVLILVAAGWVALHVLWFTIFLFITPYLKFISGDWRTVVVLTIGAFWAFSFVLLVLLSFEPILSGLVSLFILICSITVLLVELLLKLIRAIVWRIAEYNKGAFAGITLVFTILLGIIELYLKSKHSK